MLDIQMTILMMLLLAFCAYLVVLVLIYLKSKSPVFTVPINQSTQSPPVPPKNHKYTINFPNIEKSTKTINQLIIQLHKQNTPSNLAVSDEEITLTFTTPREIQNLDDLKKKGEILDYKCAEVNEECLKSS